MHNCKASRETLIALALNEPDQTQSLPAEFETCATCREEYAALRSALSVSAQTRETALPAESFWPGYHARLRQNLETGASGAGVSPVNYRQDARATKLLGNLLTTSVRVPLPLAAGLLVCLGVSIVFALNSRRPTNAAPPTVVTKTVEVPVPQDTIREKVVTRVVYRERDRRQPLDERANAIAARRKDSAAETPISLVGFKPANDVKLTIIKGSYHDEK